MVNDKINIDLRKKSAKIFRERDKKRREVAAGQGLVLEAEHCSLNTA